MLDYRQSKIKEISEEMQDCEANLQQVVHQLQKKEVLIEAVEEMETVSLRIKLTSIDILVDNIEFWC